MGGQTNPRLDGDIEQSCFAEWREGAKCADWTFPYENSLMRKWAKATVEERKQMAAENAPRKGSEDDCCCPPPKEWDRPEPPTLDEESIRLKFKLSMNFDTFTPSQSADAARYKLREITDEQAYEAGILGKMLDLYSSSRSITKTAAGDVNAAPVPEVGKMEKALDAYYEELDCIGNPGSSWEQKKDDYGDVFLICKEVWWTEDKGIGVGDTYAAIENDACYTQRGLYKKGSQLYEKGEELNAFNHHGAYVVPACYGLPDFEGTEFEDPIWQREEANECQPPHKNDYIKTEETDPETGDPIYTLGQTYQIFWRGGSSSFKPGDLSAEAIKAGQGDSPKYNSVFWNAIPNELYTLTVRHDLYQFPNFYRGDETDSNGKLTGAPLEGLPEFGVSHSDIRDVPFAYIKNTASNLPENGQAPYVAGCNCIALTDDHKNNDPLADINLSYLAGIKPNSTHTQSITVNSSEVKNLAFCTPMEHLRTIEFDPIWPTTVFKVNGKGFKKWLTEKYGDAGTDDNYNDWVNYIKEGQYSVFHVSLSPSSDPDHPNNNPNVGCHDQVSYSFAFALNLKDTFNVLGSDEPDPKCYTGSYSTSVGSVTLLPKLYYTARTAGTEIEYPGELIVKGGDGEKQCIYLSGEIFSNKKNMLAPSEYLELPSLRGATPWGIGTEDGTLLLTPDHTFGSHHFGPGGLTLLAEELESNPRISDSKEESTLETIVNLHLDLGSMYLNNAVSAGRAHKWSHFGSDNPENYTS
jgi:hypothetical protein